MGYRPTGGFKEAPFESTFHAQFPSRFKFPRAPSPCAWTLCFWGGSLSHVLCARPTREGWTGVWPRKQILDETKRLKTNRGRRSPFFGNAWTSCLVTPRLVNKRGVYYDPPRFPPPPRQLACAAERSHVFRMFGPSAYFIRRNEWVELYFWHFWKHQVCFNVF